MDKEINRIIRVHLERLTVDNLKNYSPDNNEDMLLVLLLEALNRLDAIEMRLNAIEVQLNQNKTKPAQKAFKRAHTKPVPGDLPLGTVYARDFYEKHSVSYGDFRRHTEHGFNGDLLEVTERKLYPDTRPNYKDRYLTPEQQQKAIEYWRKYGTSYVALK